MYSKNLDKVKKLKSTNAELYEQLKKKSSRKILQEKFMNFVENIGIEGEAPSSGSQKSSQRKWSSGFKNLCCGEAPVLVAWNFKGMEGNRHSPEEAGQEGIHVL